VESMRASKSSSQCRIFSFHCGGTIWRTGTLGQFAALKHPSGYRRDVLRECCGKPKALLRQWGLGDFLTERGP
jgi:hypothetical protein